MSLQRLAASLAAVTLTLSAAPSLAQDFLSAPLTTGVYICRDQSYTPIYDLWFGLIDESTYSNFDGHFGNYAYDATTGVLEIGLETGAPSLYARIGETTFRAMEKDGTLNAHVCPLNAALDESNPPW